MKIIRTQKELEALDGATLIMDSTGDILTAERFLDYVEGNPQVIWDLPAVVIATSEQIDQAWKALGEVSG